MMRWWWTRRVDAAAVEAASARVEYERTLAQRPDVEALADDLRHHRVLNGWTSTIVSIFGRVI